VLTPVVYAHDREEEALAAAAAAARRRDAEDAAQDAAEAAARARLEAAAAAERAAEEQRLQVRRPHASVRYPDRLQACMRIATSGTRHLCPAYCTAYGGAARLTKSREGLRANAAAAGRHCIATESSHYQVNDAHAASVRSARLIRLC